MSIYQFVLSCFIYVIYLYYCYGILCSRMGVINGPVGRSSRDQTSVSNSMEEGRRLTWKTPDTALLGN